MFKIYTDKRYLTAEYRRSIFPLLFDMHYLKNEITSATFEFIDSMENADFAIFPIDINLLFRSKKEYVLNAFISLAKEKGKQVWIYTAGDFGITLPFDSDVITFRLGGFNSKLNDQTYILPSFVNDPYTTIFKKEWQPILKNEKPSIGFVGNADGSFIKWCKELLIYWKQSIKRLLKKDSSDSQSFFPSSTKRYKLLEKLRLNTEIATTFICRNKYRAGAVSNEQKEKTTLVFYENIEQNIYTFCLRGSGNFSVRFYETLIMGRIPLLIDTDVRLPFHDTINWNGHCVLATSENYINKIIAFHKEHNQEQLVAIQRKNRELALEKLNRPYYFIAIAKQIRKESYEI